MSSKSNTPRVSVEHDSSNTPRVSVEHDLENSPTEKLPQAITHQPSPPPNGGTFAWMQVFAGFFAFFNSWGVVNAFGAFQNYYETTLLSDQSPSTISWIGSIQAFMVIGVSVFTGRLLDAGYLRYILFFGAFMLVFGLMMTSLSTEFYQIFLAQGVCVGIGCSCFFSSGIATVAPYFSTRRATAIGLIASGSSMGGVIYPIMAQKLIPELGFPWATRVIGFMVLGLSAFPCFILKSRVPPRKSGPLIDIESLHDWPFILFSFGTAFAFIGLYVPIFYIEPFAYKANVNPKISEYIVSILSASSIFGRVIPNIIADKTGPLNILIPCVLCAAVLVYSWIAVKGDAGVTIFAILYGFFSGSLVSIPGSVVSILTKDMSKLGTRLGMNFGVCAFGVVIGTPVAGALINGMNGSYLGAQLFAGSTVLVGVVLMTASRMLLSRGKLKYKV